MRQNRLRTTAPGGWRPGSENLGQTSLNLYPHLLSHPIYFLLRGQDFQLLKIPFYSISEIK